MNSALTVIALLGVASASFLFSTLTYSLRDLSRVRLGEALERRRRSAMLEPTMDRLGDLILVTAVGRLFANFFILLLTLHLFDRTEYGGWVRYTLAALAAGGISLISSVAVPHSLARHAGDAIVAACVGLLHGLRTLMLPLVKLMNGIDELVRRATGASDAVESEEIEQEILSAVEEGQKEGVVHQQERTMIESVIGFRDTTVGQIMTARPEIIGLALDASLSQVKQTIEQSGHSRVPVFEGTLDHIAGILYARDLLSNLGEPPERFNIRSAIRPAFYVPESKPVADLLHDFRLQKVHIAIVLDEYGGTAGLVTIEDILEELVGDISDEHEPIEPAMFKRTDDNVAEVDARLYVDELNRLMSLSLPEDAGYETVGGFVSTTLGRIPPVGATFDHAGVKYTVLEAEPQKVNRVRVEVLAHAAQIGGAAAAAEAATTKA